MRRLLLASAVAGLSALAACSGHDIVSPTRLLAPGAAAQMDASALTDTITKMIANLYPSNERTSVSARWSNVQRMLDANKDAPAQTQFQQLAQWMTDKTPDLLAPPLNETRQHAVGRLTLYMSLIVYRVPQDQQPQVSPGGDMAYAIAQPTATTQVIVPSTNAALQLDPGSVAQPVVVVISQMTSPWYPANCSGPLATPYCQYPSFYRYDEFPHIGLLKPGHFQMCHVQPGTFRSFLDGQVHGAIDSRLVLAHTAPSDPTLDVPGGRVLGNVELLPQSTNPAPRMVPDDCNGVTYPNSPNGFAMFEAPQRGFFGNAVHLLASATSAVGQLISPKNAYAYDQGVEHLALDFSPFAAVDTGGRPDVGVSALSVIGGSTPPSGGGIQAHPGDVLTLTYYVTNRSIKNGGYAAAAAPAFATTAALATDTAMKSTVAAGTTNSIAMLLPDDSVPFTVRVTVPSTASGTLYFGAGVSPSADPTQLSDNGQAPKFLSRRINVITAPLTASGGYSDGSINYTLAFQATTPSQLAPFADGCGNNKITFAQDLALPAGTFVVTPAVPHEGLTLTWNGGGFNNSQVVNGALQWLTANDPGLVNTTVQANGADFMTNHPFVVINLSPTQASCVGGPLETLSGSVANSGVFLNAIFQASDAAQQNVFSDGAGNYQITIVQDPNLPVNTSTITPSVPGQGLTFTWNGGGFANFNTLDLIYRWLVENDPNLVIQQFTTGGSMGLPAGTTIVLPLTRSP